MSIPIIAEIGWNHGGDMELAKLMILKAAESGATYAKFQTWSVDRLKPGPWDEDGRREIYEKAELSRADHVMLMEHCAECHISFLSSVFSVEDAMLLKKIGCVSVKIPSFESRNHELIKYCNEHFDVVFMSVGTSDWNEIEESVYLFDTSQLYLMHCVSSYPGKYEEANIPRMVKLKENFTQCYVGYSDHIQGVDSAKIALGEGAEVIEKHFTIDRDLPGRDNKFAILPKELRDLAEYMAKRDLMLENKNSGFQECERESREVYEGRFDG